MPKRTLFFKFGIKIVLVDKVKDRQDVFEYEGGIASFVEHLNRKEVSIT